MSNAQARILALGFLLLAAVYLFPARCYPGDDAAGEMIAASRGCLFYHPYQERKEDVRGDETSFKVLLDFPRMALESLFIISLTGFAMTRARQKTLTRL